MYKKITHNIVEEHFDHPMATAIKKAVDVDTKKKIKPGMDDMDNYYDDTDGSLGIHDPLPWNVYNDNTMLFRMDSRTAWMKWAFALLNYSISLNGDLPGTDAVKARLNKNAIALGDFLVPYYGLTAGQLLATHLIALNDIGMHYVNALKNDAPVDDIVKSWEPLVADIAKLFNELNPSNWPESLISDMFTNLVKGWQMQLTARATGDTVGDELAIDYMNKLVITGIPDHQKNGYSSIADTFSRGIIAQFPQQFSE